MLGIDDSEDISLGDLVFLTGFIFPLEISIDDFTKEEDLGQGSSGSVIKVQYIPNGMTMALKVTTSRIC